MHKPPRTMSLWVIAVGLIVTVGLRYNHAMQTVIGNFFSPFLLLKGALSGNAETDRSTSRPSGPVTTDANEPDRGLDRQLSAHKKVRVLENENRELQRLLGVSPVPDLRRVTARILNRDPASGGRRAQLDKGANHGINVGQVVLANNYVYARIIAVYKDTAIAMTILDPNCFINVAIAQTTAYGVMAGSKTQYWKSKPLCLVTYLPRDLEYTAGMSVETSILSRVIPSGLPIGVLAAGESGQIAELVDGLYVRAQVLPLCFAEEFNLVVILVGAAEEP